MTVAAPLLHIDLCLLAYQIYHQSVIWPLDPWYEFLSHKGASRRELFMQKIHAYAANPGFAGNGLHSGPGCLRGGVSNTKLDPIITNYMQIDPRLPTFNWDDSKFLSMRAPDYLLDPLKYVDVVCYTTLPSSVDSGHAKRVRLLTYAGAGTDHMMAFEGGTGSFTDGNWNSSTGPAWSLMGYVLMRKRPNNEHDIHIVFRGSRSGDAVRAAAEGMLSHGGNPDWVTDTDAVLAQNQGISRFGQVHQGFSRAVHTSLRTLRWALIKLHGLYGAPRTITVTGHSLGAGLAVHFCSVVLQSNRTAFFREHPQLSTWPWSSMQGYFMAQPPTGDKDFATNLNGRLNACAPYCVGDAVVECAEKKKAHNVTGKVMAIGAHGRQVSTLLPLPVPTGASGSENPHEVYLIRAGLRRLLEADHHTRRTPWGYYKTFRKLLAGQQFTHVADGALAPDLVTVHNVQQVLRRHQFGRYFQIYLGILRQIVEDRRVYGVYTKEGTRDVKAQRLLTAMARMAAAAPAVNNVDAAVTALDQVQELSEVQGKKFGRFLGLGSILTTIESGTYPLNSLNAFDNYPILKDCLDATHGDVEA